MSIASPVLASRESRLYAVRTITTITTTIKNTASSLLYIQFTNGPLSPHRATEPSESGISPVVVLPRKPLGVTRSFLKNNQRVPVGRNRFSVELLKLDFQIYKWTGNRRIGFVCLIFYRACLSVFSEHSYNVSAKETDNRETRAVTTRTGSELRPHLGAADLEFEFMRLEAPARPSVS